MASPTTHAAAQADLAPEPGTRSLRRRGGLGERAAEIAIQVVALLSIAAVLLILVFVGKQALPLLTSAEARREIGSLIAPVHRAGAALYMWQPVSEVPKYNVLPLVVGTVKVTLVALVFAVPLSVAAAIFVAEYARPRVREVVKPAIELLAGVPSVVVGFFVLVVLASWVQAALGTEHRLNALVAGMGLSFAICPIVFSVAEDALRAVPRSYREAALAMGSTRAQTVLRVVVPAAAPGIAAAIVLGFGRAIGETMIVLMASGNAALLDASLGRSARTITATIAQELGEVVVGSPHYDMLFLLGALLFGATFVVNFFGERIVHGMRRRLGVGAVTAAVEGRKLVGAPRRGDRALAVVTGAAVLVVLAMLAVVLFDVVAGGAGTLSWEFLSTSPREGMTAGGVLPAIFGTVLLTLLMTVAAVPAGVATAIYLTEYASRSSRTARLVRVCVANLAGVPSIVFGLFGLGFFIATVGRGIDRLAYGGETVFGRPCLLWSSLTLAILTLPVVVVATEEAILAVPRELREASLAVGATRLQTILHVVLPEALGGILTGTILAVSRGAGEVAPILFTGVAYYLPYLPTHLNDEFMNLGYHVYVLATQSPDVDRTKPLLYGTALVLLMLTLLLNLIAIWIRSRSRRRSRAES